MSIQVLLAPVHGSRGRLRAAVSIRAGVKAVSNGAGCQQVRVLGYQQVGDKKSRLAEDNMKEI